MLLDIFTRVKMWAIRPLREGGKCGRFPRFSNLQESSIPQTP